MQSDKVTETRLNETHLYRFKITGPSTGETFTFEYSNIDDGVTVRSLHSKTAKRAIRYAQDKSDIIEGCQAYLEYNDMDENENHWSFDVELEIMGKLVKTISKLTGESIPANNIETSMIDKNWKSKIQSSTDHIDRTMKMEIQCFDISKESIDKIIAKCH